MRRILITGASGLLGLNLALEAAKGVDCTPEQHTVFGVVNSHTLRSAPFQVIQADLLDPRALERLLDQTQPDWVIHCAALANLDACEANPAQARELNTELPRTLAEIVARGGARLLHVSTDAVFDGRRGPMTEDGGRITQDASSSVSGLPTYAGGYTEADAPHPMGIYSQTKLDGERAVLGANPDAIIARVNLYGWSLSGQRSLGEFFYYNLRAGRRVKGFTDVLFCPLLVNDLAQLFLKMMESGLHGLYHVVSSECISKYDFGVSVARRFSLDENLIQPVSVADANLAARRSPNLNLSNRKLTEALGEVLPNQSTGLEKFYTLYQQGYPQAIQQMGVGGASPD